METKVSEKQKAIKIEKACKEINFMKKMSLKLSKYDFFNLKLFNSEFNKFISDTCKEYDVKEDSVRKIIQM